MEARVTKAFPGVPEGEVYPRQFEVDEVVTGRMAEVAIAEGWAVEEGAKVARANGDGKDAEKYAPKNKAAH